MGDSIGECPKGMWGLTFDDGPSDVSPKLYDFLKSTNQKATLFMIGGNVLKHPDIAKRAFDEGHELAIHTWTHSYMTTLTNEQIVAELKWTEQAIKEVTGVSPRLFRPVNMLNPNMQSFVTNNCPFSLMVISITVLEILVPLLVSHVGSVAILFFSSVSSNAYIISIAVIWNHDTNDWMVNATSVFIKNPQYAFVLLLMHAYVCVCC